MCKILNLNVYTYNPTNKIRATTSIAPHTNFGSIIVVGLYFNTSVTAIIIITVK